MAVLENALLFNELQIENGHVELWQYGLWSFQRGGTKLERFLPKNQHTQRKSFNFVNKITC